MSGMLERNFHVLSLILHVYLEVGKGVHFLANFGHFMNNKKFFFFFFEKQITRNLMVKELRYLGLYYHEVLGIS